MRLYLILVLLAVGLSFKATAQTGDTLKRNVKTDSIYRKKDSDPSKRFVPKIPKPKEYHPDSTHSPHRAWTRSAFVPGWGQVYNHQWWKVPAIYVGLGLLANAIVTNHQSYKQFLAVAKYREIAIPSSSAIYANDPYLSSYQQYGDNTGISTQAIVDAKDGYFRNYEISILSFIAVWGVNIVDAYIYGKLQHSFSMDNNFSIKVNLINLNQPVYASNFNTTFAPALKVTLTLK
jgi:hypothetical protein